MIQNEQDVPTLIYILAASHSGSTLTAMLLNSHPSICTVGELKASHMGDINKYRCSCRELIGECEFWKAVSLDMRSRGVDYDVREARTSLSSIPGGYVRRLLRPLHRGAILEFVRDRLLALSPSWRKHFPVWLKRNRELLASVAKVAEVNFVADSSKIAIRLKHLRRIPGLNIKVVRLVRDGRAVSLTYVDPEEFADAADPSMRGGGSGARRDDAISMLDAARQWRRSNEEAEEIVAHLPDEDWIQISYEDLCTETSKTMATIQQFLGVQQDRSFERFRSVAHHIVGNGMRLDGSDAIVLDDRWKNALGEDQLREFDSVAGQLNRSYGYL